MKITLSCYSIQLALIAIGGSCPMHDSLGIWWGKLWHFHVEFVIISYRNYDGSCLDFSSIAKKSTQNAIEIDSNVMWNNTWTKLHHRHVFNILMGEIDNFRFLLTKNLTSQFYFDDIFYRFFSRSVSDSEIILKFWTSFSVSLLDAIIHIYFWRLCHSTSLIMIDFILYIAAANLFHLNRCCLFALASFAGPPVCAGGNKN